MADTYYRRLAQENAEEMVRLIQEYYSEWIEEIWPALTELAAPADRMQAYNAFTNGMGGADANMTWDDLKTDVPLIWKRMSADALNIIKQDEQKMNAANMGYEQSAFDQMRAYRAEEQPYGAKPGDLSGFLTGQNTPLPQVNETVQ